MDITFLSFEGCPNAEVARGRLVQAVRRVGGDPAAIHYIDVAMTDDAESLAFRGSPTILFDGRDPFADDDSPFGFSCRIYRTATATEGAPSVEALVNVLTG